MTSSVLELDLFQKQALAAVGRGSSVLLAAPTGAGKTVVAEMAIDRALSAGKGALYASPIKALSNQKYADFCARYGDSQVGMLTGDRQENPGAPLLVLTTEILHNRLITGELEGLQNVATLVLDEFHYLSDPERGSVWEESIMLCPIHVQLVCLSATLPNVQDLASWLEEHVQHLEVITESTRPVPLSFHYFAGGELHSAMDDYGKTDGTLTRFDVRPGRGPADTIVDLLPLLIQEHLAPALCFVFSRSDAERLAAASAEWLAEHMPPGPGFDAQLRKALVAVDPGVPRLPQYDALERCLRQGAGFHHAGMAPELKRIVEQLFGEGALRVLCATETFAVGLNMPARTIVLPRLTKFDGRGHRDLSAREFQQMIGRAGRRGLDKEGHVVLLADPWKPFKDAARLLTLPPEPVSSAFGFSYNTLLNVTGVYGEETANTIISSSFLVHQLERELRQTKEQLAEFAGEQPHHKPASRKLAQELERRVNGLQKSLEAGQHRRELGVMRSALAELGYCGQVAKSSLLRGIFHEHALLIAELLADHRFASSRSDGPEFAELLSWFSGDLRRKASVGTTAKLSPQLRQTRQLLDDIAGRVQRAERNSGLVITKAVAPAFPSLIYRWCTGHALSALCREYRIREGDVGGLVERTRQLLRQVSRTTSSLAEYSNVAALAASALRHLQRGGHVEDEEQTSEGIW